MAMAWITSKFFSALALRFSTQEVATKSTAVTFRAFRARTPLKRPMPAPNLGTVAKRAPTVGTVERWEMKEAYVWPMYSPGKTDDIAYVDII